ncbi:MAG TPA: S49 family peptidase, partial [Byssovorax sp.]
MLVNLVLNLVRLALWPLYALRRARAAPKGAYVVVEIAGAIAELTPPPARRFLLARARGAASPSVERVRALARALDDDPRVAGVLLKIRAIGGGEAALASMRDEVKRIRASGKDVIAWLPDGAGNRELTLASVARLVLLGPETSVSALGYAAEGRYIRRALDRAGVEPEVFARGRYKSAGDMLARDDMSEADKEQVGAILDARFDALTAAVAEGRRVERDEVVRWIHEGPHTASASVALGIVDGTAYEDELELKIAAPLRLVEID